jgi:ferredoxin-NADP reductase
VCIVFVLAVGATVAIAFRELGCRGARHLGATLLVVGLAETAWPAGKNPLAFACGPTSFVETVAGGLVALGYEPGRVKAERFGGTGGR